MEARDRKRLEQRCRYFTPPALSDERVQLNAVGQVELKLKTPWCDDTTHLVMSTLEFSSGCPRCFHGRGSIAVAMRPSTRQEAAVAQRPFMAEVGLATDRRSASIGCSIERKRHGFQRTCAGKIRSRLTP